MTLEIGFHSNRTSKSIGPVELNQPRALIRNILGKNRREKPNSDYFNDSDLLVEYDSNGKSVFIEAGMNATILLNKINVFEKSFSSMKRYF